MQVQGLQVQSHEHGVQVQGVQVHSHSQAGHSQGVQVQPLQLQQLQQLQVSSVDSLRTANRLEIARMKFDEQLAVRELHRAERVE